MLISRADQSLYDAKRKGRNRVEMWQLKNASRDPTRPPRPSLLAAGPARDGWLLIAVGPASVIFSPYEPECR